MLIPMVGFSGQELDAGAGWLESTAGNGIRQGAARKRTAFEQRIIGGLH